MALVVAMAGMMLPAMPLAEYRDWRGPMPKTDWRRFAAAATKRMATGSSLSKAGRILPPASRVRRASSRQATSSAAQSDLDHTSVARYPSLEVGGTVPAGTARSEPERASGTLSAVLYRPIPICFSISAPYRDPRTASAPPRTASSDASDPEERRARSSLTWSM